MPIAFASAFTPPAALAARVTVSCIMRRILGDAYHYGNRQMLGDDRPRLTHYRSMESWPTRLKRLRTATRMSQAKVAKALKIAAPSVAQWEIGRSKPSLDRLPALAELYGVSLEEICGTDLGSPDAARMVSTNNPEPLPASLSSQAAGDGPYSESEFAIIELWRELTPDMRNHLIGLIEAIVRNAA